MTEPNRKEAGFALIAALFVAVILLVLASTLIYQSRVQKLVEANSDDYAVALDYAESTLAWAEQRIADVSDLSQMLPGPDSASATDDNLLGLRDLSLTSTAQFTSGNEARASAIVSRDFDGNGAQSWEVIRIGNGSNMRGLAYVRIDDNFDDDPNDPANNDPLADIDNRAQVTIVTEYPIFVDGLGVERAALVDRGVARRTIVGRFAGDAFNFAMASNNDIDFTGGEVCGDCGSMHSNGDLTLSGGTDICEDGTASGSLSGSLGGIAGYASGGVDPIPLPTINPYDDRYVPTIEMFDTVGNLSLPLGLRCPLASTTDPGANKYFALVNNGQKGEVWKAYWDFTNDRWTWALIDNLQDNIDVSLDDCGRVQGDPNFGLGDSGIVVDSGKTDFYGFWGGKSQPRSCTNCTAAGRDASMCGLAENDFTTNGHFPAGGGSAVAWPHLPGSFLPDGVADVDGEARDNGQWTNNDNTAYSPLYGSVLFVAGGVNLGGNVGATGGAFLCSATALCLPFAVPNGTYPISVIATDSLTLSGSANLNPANPRAGYHYLFIAGRDLTISGNAQSDTSGCGGTCNVSAPADIAAIAGIYAAHEQVGVGGNPNIFGLLVAEEAIDCDNTVNGNSKMNGNPEVFYDCEHPPNPWNREARPRLVAWQEIE